MRKFIIFILLAAYYRNTEIRERIETGTSKERCRELGLRHKPKKFPECCHEHP